MVNSEKWYDFDEQGKLKCEVLKRESHANNGRREMGRWFQEGERDE